VVEPLLCEHKALSPQTPATPKKRKKIPMILLLREEEGQLAISVTECFVLLVFEERGFELRASHLLGRHFTT
jgi:hypothetical protein